MLFQDVKKSFGDVHALQGVSFGIPGNTIFGLLGPNGAGKTTLIRIITKIFAADAGAVIFNGKNIRSYELAGIGYMPEEKGLYKKMKVGEQLVYLAQLKGLSKKNAIEKIHYWLDKLQAGDWWHKKTEDLSKGMQQKMQFISTVIHEPQLLILDEPFSGLDPVNAEMIKTEIYALHEQGTTVLFSTHRMEQVEEMCDSIVLINKGSVMISGRVADIKNQFRQHIYDIGFETETVLQDNDLFSIEGKNGRHYSIRLQSGIKPNDVLRYCLQQEKEIIHFEEILPSLNDIFITLVNKENNA
jgi:ABC-2 type transport system ATP-binding protein